VEPVAPLMVDADVLLGIAGKLAAHHCAAMRAPVDEGLDLTRPVAIEDNRRFANPGRPEIARIGDLAVEAEKAPHRSAKYLFLFAGVDLGVVVEAVGHSAVIERRPDRSRYRGVGR